MDRVTHVCHQWRDVALRTQRLWRIVYLGLPDRVGEFLLRSGQELLDILPWNSADVTTPHWKRNNNILRRLREGPCLASLQLILTQSQRIKRFSLQLPNNIICTAFQTIDINALASLQSMRLLNDDYHVLPDILNHSKFPALTEIDIFGYQITTHPSFLLANNLGILRIYPTATPRGCTSNVCPLCSILEVLTHTNKLKILEFVDGHCTREAISTDDPHCSQFLSVELPCLEKLKIHSAPTCVDTFLANCVFPSSVAIDLLTTCMHDSSCNHGEARAGHGEADVIRSIFSKLVDGIGKEPPMSGFGLHFNQVGGRQGTLNVTIVTYHFDPLSIPSFTTDYLPSPRIHFHFDWKYPSNSKLSASMESLFQGLALDNTIHFRLSSPPLVYIGTSVAQELGIIFSRLISRCSPSGLQALEFYGSSVAVFPHILTSWTRTHFSLSGTAHPTMCVHNNNPSLFCFIHSLIIGTQEGRLMRWRGQARSLDADMGYVLDAIESQAGLYIGSCGKFSALVLQRCGLDLKATVELVEAIASVVRQQGRFTRNPPVVPHEIQHHLPYNLLNWWPPCPPSKDEQLPDDDLDRPPLAAQLHGNGNNLHNNIAPVVPQLALREPIWVDHARDGRIIFDFRGSSGIQVEQHVSPTVGRWGPTVTRNIIHHLVWN
ncbi:hypothetical protein QCA50_006193 [Cerrena zonata]|uniref:F-box domain-containing protein n=1 Tax=Cerrena zonata TaxID=2478898 RepID=A0AAW0GPD3_9APHY